MSLATSFSGKANEAMHTDVSGLIQAAQNVYRKLHAGFTGRGLHRVPVGGDMNEFPFAVGLTTLEKKLAWAAKYIASNMAGTQALRQIMGHRLFGARVNYGDCLFFTISPHEQHSAL
eukprot:8199870-Karenia_brevis.AAC.1